MVRIEDFDDDLELEDEPIRPRKRKKKKRRRKSLWSRLKFNCCLFLLVIFFGFVIISLATLAKSGIFQIPFFSDIFYKIPEPTRIVEISQTDINQFSQGLNVKVTPEKITLDVSEEELTHFLRQILAKGENPYFTNTVQAVIEPEGVEVFGLLLRPVKANLTVWLAPELIENRFNLKVNNI